MHSAVADPDHRERRPRRLRYNLGMLMIGTSEHLEDLDREYTIAEDVSVTALAAAGSATYVLLDGERVARIDEFEVSPLAALPSPPAGTCMAGLGARLVIGTRGAHLLTVDLADGSVSPLASFDEVPGRDGWENPAGPTPDLRSCAVTSNGALLANVHVGGVWRSADGGSTWQNVVPPEADVHEVVAGSEGRAAIAAARGLAWSTDDGVSWQWTTDGLHAPYCRAVTLDGETVFVTASTGPRTDDGRLYRAALGGPLSQCTEGLPASFPFNIDTACLDARAGEVAFGTSDGKLFRSKDAGALYVLAAERMRPVQVVRFF